MAGEERESTIPEVLERAARLFPEAIAYETATGRVTYRELSDRAAAFAAGLLALGLRQGDRVAICAENSIEWITAYHGAVLAGGAGVPIYATLRPAEVAEQVRRPECRFVVASDETLAKVPERSPGLEKVIVIGEGRRDGRAGFLRRHPAETLPFEGVAAAATDDSRRALAGRAPAPDDLAAVIFTSGTTGGAKGVMLTHRNFTANAYSVLGALHVGGTDTVLLVLPLHHAMPFLACIVLPPLVGARVFIENDVRRVRDRMVQVGPTIFFGVPALYELMYRNVLARAESEGRLEQLQAFQRRVVAVKTRTGVNLAPVLFRQVHKALGGRLRFLVSGGAPLKPATALDYFSLGLPLLQGWGLTEAAPVIAVQRYSAPRFHFTRYYEEHAGSVGQALPGVEVRLVDVPEKDLYVSLGGEGELVVRGENVFPGYWRAPEQTREVKLDGWLRTGDVGRIAADGSIYITGRSKYIIVLDSGEKVHPDELEERFAESAIIGDVCVLPRKARDKTQVAAVVYPDPERTAERLRAAGLDLSEESVRRLVGEEIERLGRDLAPYKRVARVELSDTPLPKTALQKVARGQLPEEISFSLRHWQEEREPAHTP
jgi:long-chain acyl-CoA synthetase